jgi:hypothetical protein
MILMRANLLLRPLEGVGPENGTRFARFHFRALKSLDFQGPPLPMALAMDVGRIEIITSRDINNRYINSYFASLPDLFF